jgi:hypothetical protein
MTMVNRTVWSNPDFLAGQPKSIHQHGFVPLEISEKHGKPHRRSKSPGEAYIHLGWPGSPTSTPSGEDLLASFFWLPLKILCMFPQ